MVRTELLQRIANLTTGTPVVVEYAPLQDGAYWSGADVRVVKRAGYHIIQLDSYGVGDRDEEIEAFAAGLFVAHGGCDAETATKHAGKISAKIRRLHDQLERNPDARLKTIRF